MAFSHSNLKSSTANFNQMLKRFGVVTVMNARVYEAIDTELLATLNVNDILKAANAETEDGGLDFGETKVKFLTKLDTLKVSNINFEGPTKTVTGGQYSNPLIKYGKTATVEMQDALGNAEALEAFGAGVLEHFEKGTAGSNLDNPGIIKGEGASYVFHFTSDFAGERLIIGESFFIDQKTGSQVPVKVILYRFLPDSIENLSQDADGDATVFDLNGSLLAADILVGDETGTQVKHGVFYTITPTFAIDVEPQPQVRPV